MFRDSPWMGKGFHSYATYQSHYLTAAEKETYFYVPQEIHNFYLDVACGMGVMGLAALLYFLFCAARNLLAVWPRFSAGSDREQVFYVALSTGIVALLNNVTDSHFYSTYGGPIALYFLAMGQALSIRSPHDA